MVACCLGKLGFWHCACHVWPIARFCITQYERQQRAGITGYRCISVLHNLQECGREGRGMEGSLELWMRMASRARVCKDAIVCFGHLLLLVADPHPSRSLHVLYICLRQPCTTCCGQGLASGVPRVVTFVRPTLKGGIEKVQLGRTGAWRIIQRLH